MLITFIFIIIALFNSITEGSSYAHEQPVYVENYAIKCAEQVLSAEYLDTKETPKREQYKNDTDFKIAKAKYLNGGQLVTLEDGTECSL
jgi:hypothetical protein